MTQETIADTVKFFSSSVEEFHAYYRDRPEFQERFDIWRELLDRHGTPGGFSIDMGCGTGIFAFYLAEKGGRVVGVDGAPEMVKFCHAQRAKRGVGNLQFMEARLPLLDETLLANADLIISSSVVEYVEDLDETLALFSRLLQPRATLIVSMPNVWCINRIVQRLRHMLTGEPEIYHYIRHFSSPRQLQARVGRFGLTLEGARYYSHFTRLAKLTRMLRLPLALTEDLFVVVLRKS